MIPPIKPAPKVLANSPPIIPGAALVEEAAAATASLANEAGGLTQAVSLFKFGRAPSRVRGGSGAGNGKPVRPVTDTKRLAA